MVRFGWHGEARLGGVWLDEVRRGLLRLAWMPNFNRRFLHEKSKRLCVEKHANR